MIDPLPILKRLEKAPREYGIPCRVCNGEIFSHAPDCQLKAVIRQLEQSAHEIRTGAYRVLAGRGFA